MFLLEQRREEWQIDIQLPLWVTQLVRLNHGIY